MAKYLGTSTLLALGQDENGNVDRWYAIGDDIPDSLLKGNLARWLVNSGFTFDPMPSDAPAPPATAVMASPLAVAQAAAAPPSGTPPPEESRSKKNND